MARIQDLPKTEINYDLPVKNVPYGPVSLRLEISPDFPRKIPIFLPMLFLAFQGSYLLLYSSREKKRAITLIVI